MLAGGAPLFFGERAFEKLQRRKSKVSSYYFDLNLVGDYWGWFDKRFYHHTGMTSTWFATLWRSSRILTCRPGCSKTILGGLLCSNTFQVA